MRYDSQVYVFALRAAEMLTFQRMMVFGSLETFTHLISSIRDGRDGAELASFEALAQTTSQLFGFYRDYSIALATAQQTGGWEFGVPKHILDFMNGIARTPALQTSDPKLHQFLVDDGHSVDDYDRTLKRIQAALDGAVSMPAAAPDEPCINVPSPPCVQ